MSVAVNIVEGSTRRGEREYLHFLNVAAGSAAEARYLIGLSCRLGFLDVTQGESLQADYGKVPGALVALIQSLSPKP